MILRKTKQDVVTDMDQYDAEQLSEVLYREIEHEIEHYCELDKKAQEMTRERLKATVSKHNILKWVRKIESGKD